MAVQLSGIGVSRGIAIGRAHLLERHHLDVTEYRITEDLIEAEVERFRLALGGAREQLRGIRGRIPPDTSADIVEFIDTHLLMLEDSTLTVAPELLIRNQGINAEWALKQQRDALVQVFEAMDDAYLRTRKDDIDHVVSRIQRLLVHDEKVQDLGAADHLKGSIVLADELTPADAVLLYHQGAAGFITEYGGPLSHTAIVARSLRIPTLVGVHNIHRYIQDGETLILDGQEGLVLAGADAPVLEHYRQRQAEELERAHVLVKTRYEPACTQDGVSIRLLGNIELLEDVEEVIDAGAEGVGLYRTEFLYMNREDTPDEEEQLEHYRAVIDQLRGRPLTIRTLDLGADKALDQETAHHCANPALGLRAIRLCLHDPSLFRPQLKAVLRAAALGPVEMMLPMLSSLGELRQALALIAEVKQELAAEGKDFDAAMPVGGMIEVPAAALAADMFAAELDFLSIGTNDLIQYTLAIDRVDDEVNYLYDPTHPAVLDLIRRIIQAGARHKVPVSMCGEMAGDPLYSRLLLGLGLNSFSMQASSLLEVKHLIRQTRLDRIMEPVETLMQTWDPDRRAELLAQIQNLQCT
ncbi:phosphoenolpyruvate--protein phosphotransferase [Thiohalobacter thiocyanaticus]|uniref:Phosphoenolpyruvate-protein phosphotransferase n=1 Tax=Thiohalobacter thiocyanaticus TaxID=585455 RepID=A0A426QHK7_9GAMM|nr:phosphoenolpyruvate--protein phosphotransferase [Thiohalobacter thiocyanaticus]RRQ21237.1 phosphoenolpyruvate--protein phosphotransferase [Thiohalobacter thiocyanaticus]